MTIFYSFFLIFVQMARAKPNVIFSKSITTSEFGLVDLIVEEDGERCIAHFDHHKRGRVQTTDVLNGRMMFEGYDVLKVEVFDANGDGKDDLFLRGEMMIGAGPQAGMSDYKYYPLIFTAKQFVLSPYKSNMEHDIHDIHYHGDMSSLINYLQHWYQKGEAPQILGTKIPKGSFFGFLVKDDEALIFTMMLSQKRVTIALADDGRHLVYRIGKKGEVEFEFMQQKEEQPLFRYYREDNYGFDRYFIKHVEFRNKEYTYRIYSNTIEGSADGHIGGQGVVVFNNKSGSKTVLQADPKSERGDLRDLEKVSFIAHQFHHGNDYDDE
jgi:hypothetical protein